MTKFCCVSDLHGTLPYIPECDVLLIAGDVCAYTSKLKEIYASVLSESDLRLSYAGSPVNIRLQSFWLKDYFSPWLDKVPAKYKIGIAGNHDWIFQYGKDSIPELNWNLLQDSSITVDNFKIYGTAWQPYFHGWAYNLEESELEKKYKLIPDDADIVITHSPPFGFGDLTRTMERVGSPSLLENLLRVKPKLNVHGHIHEDCGVRHYKDIIFANASNHREPLIFDLTK